MIPFREMIPLEKGALTQAEDEKIGRHLSNGISPKGKNLRISERDVTSIKRRCRVRDRAGAKRKGPSKKMMTFSDGPAQNPESAIARPGNRRDM